MEGFVFLLWRRIRCFFFTKLLSPFLSSYGSDLRVNGLSIVSRRASVHVGNNVNFNGIRIIGKGSVVIGDYFHSGQNVKIMLGSHDYDYGSAIPYGKEETEKKVTIGDFVWLGQDVTISGNVNIGEGAIVAIGSMVVKDVPPFAIVGGNPARVIKYRNKDHYNELKAQGKYH